VSLFGHRCPLAPGIGIGPIADQAGRDNAGTERKHSKMYRHKAWLSTSRLVLLVVFGGMLTVEAFAQAPSPKKVLGQYQQFVWTDQQGLPQNTVQALTRSRDGYLWIGTLAGAVRYDGARFTVFDSSNTDAIKGSYIMALVEDNDGTLWMGVDGGGVVAFRAGRFSVYTTANGLPGNYVKSLVAARDGSLWIGTEGGLAQLKDGSFTVYTTANGLADNLVPALAEDNDGGIWAGTGRGLTLIKGGRLRNYTDRDGLVQNVVRSMLIDRAGAVWIGTDAGLSRFKDDSFTTYGAQYGLPSTQVRALCLDSAGSLWIGTLGSGVFRLNEGGAEGFGSRDGLPGDRIAAIFQDPEGDIWIGTDGGLSQLREGHFHVYTTQEGLANDFCMAVYGDSAGGLWIGSVDGLSHIKNGKITAYTEKDGLPKKEIRSITEDRDGNIWLGAFGAGVLEFKDGRFTAWTARDGLSSDLVFAVYADTANNLWVATANSGLSVFRNGRFTSYRTKDGLASDSLRTIFEDREHNIWIGTQDAGVSRFKDGRFTNWSVNEGLSGNAVVSFYEDASGALWMGTIDGGLTRFKDGKFAKVTSKDGLFDNVAFRILPDGQGDSANLWMSCNRGIYRVSEKELNEFADGRLPSVTCFAYGPVDGMVSRECNSATPGGWRTDDGRLWFPSTRGLVVIDPQMLDSHPPPLMLEAVTLDRVPMPTDRPVQVGPGQENLQIDYTAISWGRPQQIRFRYQLVGLDREWIDAGPRRTAYYDHLPSGDYTFKVIADNGEGVWNYDGVTIPVRITPRFYQRRWFTMLLGGAIAGLALAFYKIRINRVQRRQAQQERFTRVLLQAQEAERKRIAAELHDSLGQNLLVIKNRALMGLREKEAPAATREQLEEISSVSSQSLDEVREIAYNLRPYQIDRLGLGRAIESMIRKMAISSGIQFTVDVASIKDIFPKESEIHFYRIAQECVNNIVKHSGATEASVSIELSGQKVDLHVKDNGNGFEVERNGPVESARSGFGLIGLSERVRILGGTFSIRSAPGQGTTVSVSVPANNNHEGP
jgi:signal transduction histidine kinase/ligand-binding sensor domain-containing protein